MPDFTARFTAGVQLTPWDDHAGSGVPRTNPIPARPHRYYRAQIGVQVEIKATVGGVEGPLDGALGGRLFSSDFAEYPGPPIVPAGVAGQSSVQRFTPQHLGHYLWVMRRATGGAFAMHMDVE